MMMQASATNNGAGNTHERELRSRLKRIELLLDNASNRLREENNNNQTIFTTVSSALTTTNNNNCSITTHNNNNNNNNNNQQPLVNERRSTLNDIDALKNVLACPIFNRLIDVQESLDKLTQQMQLHPSISLADFHIDENSGELILAPPLENTSTCLQDAETATILSQQNNPKANSIILNHNQQQQLLQQQQPKQSTINQFNHQTEILFNDSNLQNSHHLIFNGSQFDVNQHVLQSLQQHQNSLTNDALKGHTQSSSNTIDYNTSLTRTTKQQDYRPVANVEFDVDTFKKQHPTDGQYNSVNYTTVVQSNNGDESTVITGNSADTTRLHHNQTASPNEHLINIDNNNSNQKQLNKTPTIDETNPTPIYSTVDHTNKQQIPRDTTLATRYNLADKNNSPRSINNSEQSGVTSNVYQRQAITIMSPKISNSLIRNTNQTTSMPLKEVKLTSLDTYTTTTITTPVAEKLLDGDINLIGRISCSPSTSIGSTVKLVDEGYSGASSLQSNVEKNTTSETNPWSQTRASSLINNSKNIPTSSTNNIVRDSPLDDVRFTSPIQNDSPLEHLDLQSDLVKSTLIKSPNEDVTSPPCVSESSSPEMERLTVTLEKNEKGLGITVNGFVCEREDLAGIFIGEIDPNSPAGLNGNIRKHDQIIAVDGKTLTRYSPNISLLDRNQRAIEVLRRTGKTLTLDLMRFINHKNPRYQSLQQALNTVSSATLPVTADKPGIVSRVDTGGRLKDANLTNRFVMESKQPSNSCNEGNITSDLPASKHDNAQPRVTQIRPVLAPKPASIISQSSSSHILGSRMATDNSHINSSSRQQQISSVRKGKAPQPPIQRALTTSDVTERLEHRNSIPSRHPSEKIIESLTGSRNKINITANTNHIKTDATINVSTSAQDATQTHQNDICGPNIRQHSVPIEVETAKTSNISTQEFNILDRSNSHHSNLEDKTEILVENENDINYSNVASNDCIAEDTNNEQYIQTEMPMWNEKNKAQIIKLYKGDQKGLGFSVLDYHDPIDTRQTVIVIRSLVAGGIADLDGRLVPGDRLLFVDDVDLRNATLEKAVRALKKANGWVSLGVLKPILYYSSKTGEKTNSYSQ